MIKLKSEYTALINVKHFKMKLISPVHQSINSVACELIL